MKKLIMLAVATVMALNMAQAADDDKKKAPRKGRGVQALLKQLDLSADQKKALATFNKENRKKNTEARKLKGEERKAAMKKIAEARNAKLKEILTEEQVKKLKELQTKAQGDRKGKKKKSEDK